VGEPTAVIICLAVVWEVLTRAEVLPSRDLPPVTAIAAALAGDLQEPRLWSAVAATLLAWAIGISGAVLIGVPIGLSLGSQKLLYLTCQPSLEFIRTIPSVAALPLLILFFGSRGPALPATMAFLAAVWPIVIQTMYGVRDVDPTTKDTGRAYGLGRFQLFQRVVVPSALPYVATGVRLGTVLGLLLAVASSLIAGGEGLGFLIVSASFSGVPELVYARILLAGLIGLLVTGVLLFVESRVLFWHSSHRVANA
jgi:ABC-type nitrate/sulfonate/bicarbonate transport system permease component